MTGIVIIRLTLNKKCEIVEKLGLIFVQYELNVLTKFERLNLIEPGLEIMIKVIAQTNRFFVLICNFCVFFW